MTPIVTLTDTLYLPGLYALLESMAQNANLPDDQAIYVIDIDGICTKDVRAAQSFGFNVIFLSRLGNNDSELALPFSDEWQVPFWYTWMRKVMKKLWAFKLTGIEKVVWIDADMLCLGDLNEAFDMDPLSAVPEPDSAPEICGNTMFCSGFMVLQPSEEDYQGMVKRMHEPSARDLFLIKPSGDQVLINDYFYRTNRPVHLVDESWGINKRLIEIDPVWFTELMNDDPKLLHLVGAKPWYCSEGEPYQPVEDLWHRYYRQAMERIRKGEQA